MFLAILLLLTAYLLGAMPWGLWIGLVFFHKNLHEFGSHNTGTTNTFRVLGTTAGIIVFILDFLKGAVAVLLPLWFHSHVIPNLIFGLIAVLGHTASIFDRFRGGKAVATSGGVVFAYSPLFVAYLLVIFLIVLLLFSMISLSSISAAIAALLGIFIFPAFHIIFSHYDWLFTLTVLILAAIILNRHRENIHRIRSHTENIVPFGLNLSQQKKA